MKKRFLPLLLLLLLCLPGMGGAEGLPTVRLDAAQLDYVAARPGTLTVGDFTTPVTVKYRGTYSFTFTGKRNYSLHLKDAAGNPRKASLLGLRRDDDYVLLGALSDPSRLRNPVGLELWRAMGHAAPRMAACELYFGPYYKGVYFLGERPDRKSAGLPAGGALYRVLAERADGVDLFSAEDPGAPGTDEWYNVGKVYPADAAGWQPLRDLLAGGESCMDLDAFADYYLFVNLSGATDNMTKNLFLCWDGALFAPMPWDLDAAFGRLYTAEPSDRTAWYAGPLFDRLLADPGFESVLRRRWAVQRELLAPDAVMARFTAWYDRLADAGAWERERARFPDYTDSVTGVTHPLAPEEELSFIRDFLTARFDLLDAAYGGNP